MGEIVRFMPKPELERLRLVRQAHAIYESVFPTSAASEPRHAVSADGAAGGANLNSDDDWS